MAFSSSHSGDVLSCSVDDYVIDNIQTQEEEAHFSAHQDYQGFNMLTPQTNNNWIMNLPIGVRFRPTDEELVMQYLQLESFGLDSSGIITHADIYDFHPKELSGLVKVDHGDGKMYFYTYLKKIAKNSEKMGKNSARRIKSKSTDYWKLTQTNNEVRSIYGNIQGYKSSLVFYEGNNKTQWLMQEYKLSKSSTAAEELVLAVVYLYDRKRKRDDNGDS